MELKVRWHGIKHISDSHDHITTSGVETITEEDILEMINVKIKDKGGVTATYEAEDIEIENIDL